MLHHGDCISVMNQHIEPQSVDMVLVDPPYGTTECKWDSVIPLAEMWAAIKRVAKKDAALVLFCAQPFTTALIHSNIKHFRYCWVWDKIVPSGFNYARFQPMRQHEDIAVFYQSAPRYDCNAAKRTEPIKRRRASKLSLSSHVTLREDFVPRELTHKMKRSILHFPKVHRGAIHPTQKPVPLLEYLIKTYSKEGDTVLDFTMGSGSTGVACANTGRKFIGIERDAAYFSTASARIAAALAVLK